MAGGFGRRAGHGSSGVPMNLCDDWWTMWVSGPLCSRCGVGTGAGTAASATLMLPHLVALSEAEPTPPTAVTHTSAAWLPPSLFFSTSVARI